MQTAKLFQSGQYQAIELPQNFTFPGNKVFIKKNGNTIVLLPIENPWDSLINSLSDFSEDFMNDRDAL